jgi:hypothetical protein
LNGLGWLQAKTHGPIVGPKLLIEKEFSCPAASHHVPLEQATNQGVVGSNPASRANQINGLASQKLTRFALRDAQG